MKIDYWSDYACPYCYIGRVRLKNAIRDLGMEDEIEIEMHPYELAPDAPAEPTGDTISRYAEKYNVSLDEAKEHADEISQLGRDLGLDFNYATAKNTNTFDAHRLTKFAHSKGNTAIEELLFAANFTKNLPLSDHNVLLDIAEQAGLDREEAAEVLTGKAFANDVVVDELDAKILGGTVVPFFVLDGKLAIPGCMPEEGFKNAIQQALDGESA